MGGTGRQKLYHNDHTELCSKEVTIGMEKLLVMKM